MQHVLRRLMLASIWVMAVAVIALWARSYREVQTLHLGRGKWGTTQVGCDCGRLFWVWCASTRQMADRPPAFRAVAYQPTTWAAYESVLARGSAGRWDTLGFGYDHGVMDGANVPRQYRQARAPLWAAVLVLAVAPAVGALRALRRRRWSRTGRCAGCGYDLRASVGRCPECGRETTHTDVTHAPRATRLWRRRTITFAAAVVVAAAVYVAWPPNSARDAVRLVGHWEVLQPDLEDGDRAYLRFDRTAAVKLIRTAIFDRRGRLREITSVQAVVVDGDFLFFGVGGDPSRFWFDGSTLVVDALTAPRPEPQRYAPVRATNAPATQPFTPR